MNAVHELLPIVGVLGACAALAVSRATFYRRRSAEVTCAPKRSAPARALNAEERQAILDVANSERFVDTAPAEIVATLLDEKKYLCSTRTMYRILEAAGEVRERRDQLRHPEYKRPELLATAPNQVWSWDITKLLGPEKWKYFYLYVLIDIYSRYVVGWLLAEQENATFAKRLIGETCKKEEIEEGQLTIHGDRGAPMTSKTLAQLMADLTITKSHSRPRVSDDNPFSESQFKTMKYQPDYPGRFSGLDAARLHCRDFFEWYNNEHRHSGIAFLTPADVHQGRSTGVIAARQATLDAAFALHPERFVRRAPNALLLPPAVWINPPPYVSNGTAVPNTIDQLPLRPKPTSSEIVAISTGSPETTQSALILSNWPVSNGTAEINISGRPESEVTH
jgi:putative transposase